MQASAISTFHTALGLFLNYQEALELDQPERTLYLAVPNQAYKNFFEKRFLQRMVSKYQLKFLIYDPKNEVIVEWEK